MSYPRHDPALESSTDRSFGRPPVRLRHFRYERTEEVPLPAGAPSQRGHELTEVRPDVAGFGMKLFLVSLTMVFGSTFVAFGIIRWRNRDAWESIVDSREILGLVAASVLLVVADVASMRALKRTQTRSIASRLTLVTLISATLYLGVQTVSWLPLWAKRDPVDGGDLTMPGVLFLMLTFAHALHVLGGIIANAIVLLRARMGTGPTRNALRLLYTYWRFLTVMWVAVLVLLAL